MPGATSDSPTELDASRNRFAFTGHYCDPETNLYNAKARYFDPKLGRFLTQDSYLGQIDKPPSLHRYVYGLNNPTAFIDPTGHMSRRLQEHYAKVEARMRTAGSDAERARSGLRALVPRWRRRTKLRIRSPSQSCSAWRVSQT